MPNEVIERAKEILNNYENNSKTKKNNEQIKFNFVEKEDKLRDRLKEINPLELTPMEAINILYELKTLDK